jgi:hypothetical protein
MALGGSGGALAGHMVQEWDDGRHHETGVALRHGTLGDRRKGEGTHMMSAINHMPMQRRG